MKFLIPHDNGVWVRDIVVSELQVASLGLYGAESSQEYPLIPTCSTLQCGIRVAGCSVGPGWAKKQSKVKCGINVLGYIIGTR